MIPITLRVGQRTFHIVFAEIDTLLPDGTFLSLGYYDDIETITIASSLGNTMTKIVLCHEIFEAINSHVGSGLKHNQIQGVANCMLDIMCDNPDIVQYLFKGGMDEQELQARTGMDRQEEQIQQAVCKQGGETHKRRSKS